jgi:hypothetical protein
MPPFHFLKGVLIYCSAIIFRVKQFTHLQHPFSLHYSAVRL